MQLLLFLLPHQASGPVDSGKNVSNALLNFTRFWCSFLNPDVDIMGIGGSTASRSSPVKVIPVQPNTNQISPERLPEAFQPTRPPVTSNVISHANTSGCCDHREANHAHSSGSSSALASERTASFASSRSRKNSIDEEIEEIVANTIDLSHNNNNTSPTSRANEIPRRKPTDKNLFPSESASETLDRLRKSSRLRSSDRAFERVRNEELMDVTPARERKSRDDFNRVNVIDDVDFEKFKRVNHKGSAQQKNGKVIHHQDSDLLWRLGLISPETYTMKSSTRSAPVTQDDYLKPPSYDLTEEQLMANIEKEYTEYAGAVN